jgi:hypothetical protein
LLSLDADLCEDSNWEDHYLEGRII